jgi:hypothetical protein
MSRRLMTTDEHAICELLGDLHWRIKRVIQGPQALRDWQEATFHIHALQNMIMSQAAARAYPERYRLLGEASEQFLDPGNRQQEPPHA